VAGTAALLAGLHVGGVWSRLAVSLIMGAAVTGMHYTGMAAMRVYAGPGGMTMTGTPGQLPVPAATGGQRPHLSAGADHRDITQRGGDPRRRQPERASGSGA
jgi:Bacterial signalling protein N terminal repeat